MLQTENGISSHKGFLCLCCISAENYTTQYLKLKQSSKLVQFNRLINKEVIGLLVS